MSEHLPSSGHAANQLVEIEMRCDEYIQLHRSGTAPTQEEFAAQFPELESQILELLPAVVLMESARSRKFLKRKDGRVMSGPEEIVQLGDYHIVHELGRGGMGIVYEAHQASLDRRVALKVLPKHSLSPRQVEKFFIEASTAAKLHHTNIAPIYDVGTHDGFHYFSMQLLKGNSLESYVSSASLANEPGTARFTSDNYEIEKFSIADVMDIGQQVASALQYAHNQGVFHRDIKPANLVRDSGSNVWVTDFGLAITHGQQRIQSEAMSGTLRYMSPEKLRKSSSKEKEEAITFDREGDVYSLGVTLIELLSGSPAFPSPGVVELIDDISKGRMVDLHHEGRALPSDLEAVLRKAVAADPTQRYPTIADFAEDLENFSASRPVNAIETNWVGNSFRWVKRNLALTVVSALAAYLVIVVSVISTSSIISTNSQINEERLRRVRSEETILLASKSFEKTFKPYGPLTVFGGGKISSAGNVAEISKPVVDVLEKLSNEYFAFAQSNKDLPKLKVDSNFAQCYVADLRLQLGDYDAAQILLQEALDDLKDRMAETDSLEMESDLTMSLRSSPFSIAGTLHLARVNNQLGFAMTNSTTLLTEKDRAVQAKQLNVARNLHVTALKSLEKASSKNSIVMLELARTLHLLGRTNEPRYRPDMYPGEIGDEAIAVSELRKRRAWNNRAILILQSIDREDGYQDERSRLLALCLIEKSKVLKELDVNDPGVVESLDLARDILRKLVSAYPDNSGLKYDLNRAFAESNPDLASLEKAVALSETIAQDRFVLPTYLIQEVRLRRLLAIACKQKSREKNERDWLRQEETHRRRVLEVHQLQDPLGVSLTSDYSVLEKSHRHQTWTAQFTLELAECESLDDRMSERDALIGDAVKTLHHLPKDVLEREDASALLLKAKSMSRKSLVQ